MLSKPEWFKRRKYSGWGFSPATWQGWVYLLVFILPIIIVSNMHLFGTVGTIFLVIWALIFCIDFINIIIHLPKDERDRMHEAIAERNALWVILTVLAGGIAYQTATSVASKNITAIDPIIIIAIVAGLIAKIISNVYLDKRD